MSDAEALRRTNGLRTLRDFLRFAVSRFTAAEVAYGQGTANAVDEAAFIILETLHLPIDQLDPFLDARLTKAERKKLTAAIDARAHGRKPAAYVTRRAYIQGVAFRADPRAIVPRSFIGELLAGAAEAGDPTDGLPGGDLFAAPGMPRRVRRILDLCTGGGSLAILAALRWPGAQVDATDISADALALAAENVALHGLEERVRLLEGDLFSSLRTRRYDLILANPPYVDAEAIAAFPPEFRAEPELAHAGGPDGLDIVRRILAGAPQRLTAAGVLVCEIGRGRALLAAERPDLAFRWIDTEESRGEVFCLSKADFAIAGMAAPRGAKAGGKVAAEAADDPPPALPGKAAG